MVAPANSGPSSSAGASSGANHHQQEQQHQHHHHHQQPQQQQQHNHNNSNNNNEPDAGIGEWNRIEPVAGGRGGENGGGGGGGGGGAGGGNGGGGGNANQGNNQNNANAEECDRFSFEDSDRFEEDSLCSWSSEPESVCNNWRGWKRPTAGMTNSFGGSFSRRTADGEPTSLTELAARCVASYIPFELCEHLYPPVPEQMQLRIAFWSFPDNEEDIRLYSCLANSSADEFHRGEQLFKNRAVKDPLQIGFHLSATVVQTQPRNQFNVAVTFDRRRISSCSCTCLPTAYWCSHVVAVCLYRIHCPTKVSLRAPVSESLSRLQREQLQKFAQYLISEQSQQILPIAQRLLDELLSAQPTTINTVCGAPDPTAGASVNDQTNWYLDEKTLHDNIKKILIKFCLPTPMVFSDVNYLTNSAPPAAAEWSSLLRPLRGREPEGMWNLLSIVREMYRRCDRNAVRLLEILTEEVMACDQILVWWFNIKLALLVGSNGHGGGGGGGGGGKHGNTHSNSNATQHACASLCDEIVVLWRLAALNPGLAPDERDMLHAQFTTWHLKILDRVQKNLVASSSHSSKQQQNLRNDAELFAGFKPAIEACYLDWEDYPIEGVTHTQDTNPMYHCPFTCFKQNSETRGDTVGPGQVNSSQAVMQNSVKQFQLMPHHHHHHSYHGDHHHHHHHHQQQQQHHVHNNHASSSTSIMSSATDRYRSVIAGPSGLSRSQQSQQSGPSGSLTATVGSATTAPHMVTRSGLNGLTKVVSPNERTNQSAPAPESSTSGRSTTLGGSSVEPTAADGSNNRDMVARDSATDLASKNHHYRRGATRDRPYGSSSNNSSSDSVPERLNQASTSGVPTTSDSNNVVVSPSGTDDTNKNRPSCGEERVGSGVVAVCDVPLGSGGNRSSVSSEGFCENEDDLPGSSGEEKLHGTSVGRVSASAAAGVTPGSSGNGGGGAGVSSGAVSESVTLLLSVSNSSSSSSSSSTSLSSSSAATDLLLQAKKKEEEAAVVAVSSMIEGTGSLSSESSNENSILNGMTTYKMSGKSMLYDVLKLRYDEQETVAATESDTVSAPVTTTSSGKQNSAKHVDVPVADGRKDGATDESEASKGATGQTADTTGGATFDAQTAVQQQVQQQPLATSKSLKQPSSESKQQQQVFSNIKPSEDAWDILFARAEGLHAHGHGREACTLGVRLAEEMLAHPPNLMIDLPPPPKKKGKKHNINPISHQLSVLASATLSKCAFLCTVLAENSEHYHLAFRVCLFGLELSRPPASTKPLEVKLANQESDLLALLKRIPLGHAELKIIRERAEQLRDGTLKSRGEALLPIMLASFIFDALVMPSVIGRENRMKVMSSSARFPTDENLGFEAAVAALGLKANVSEAEHPLLCEGTRRQRGDLALTLLSYYKDEPRKICRIMEKLLDREIHVLIKTPLLPSYYSNNPPTRSQTSQLRMEEYEAATNGGNHHHHQQHLQPYGAGASGNNGRSSSSTGSAELQVAAGAATAGVAAPAHLAQGAEFCLVSSSRPQSSTSAEIELAIGALSLGGTVAASGSGGAGGSATNATAGSGTAASSSSTTATATTTTTAGATTSTRSKDSRYKGKRAYPSIPNQPSEASAHFMFELAKNVLTKAGGTSSTSLFTQASTNTNHQGPHRGLHMCAFQLGLYALGLHNCVSPNWLSRTYSSHVSWIIGQAMDIGAPAISFLIDTWEGHLTPPEAAGMADRASSRGWDSNMVNPAAELALSVLPHAAALNPNEIQRAILQCKEQSDRMLERACITVENAAKGGGVYPEVLFQVSRYWYELYLRNTPGGEMEPEEQHDYFNVNLMSLIDSGGADSANGMLVAGANVAGPGGQGGPSGVPGGAPVGVGGAPQQPYPHQHQTLASIGLSPYGGYGFQGALYHHQNMPYGAHATNQMHQAMAYMATPPQFQYPPPPPPAAHGGQQQQPPQPGAGGYGQSAGPLNPQAAAAAAAAVAAVAYQSMQPHGVPPQGYGTPPQYQGVPVQPPGPPANAGPMQPPNLQQYYGNPQAAVAAAMQQQQQQQQQSVSVGGQMPPQMAQLPAAVAAAAAAAAAAAHSAAQQQQQQQVVQGPPLPQGSSASQPGGPSNMTGANSMRQQSSCPGGVAGGSPYAGYGLAGPGAPTGAGVGGPPQSVVSSTGSSSGGPVGRPRHPHQFSPTQLRYLLATYNAGMLALETLARRVHDDRPQAKYARNPPYGEDVKWLLRISKKLGTQYLHQFCICVVNSIVSPFVLHEVAIESAHYLARNNPALVMQHLRSALTPLMSKCQSMYFQCIHQKLYHLTVPDYEDFTSTILSARNAFQITPEGNAQFKDWLQSIKRSKSCKKELWSQINAALNSK